MTESKIAEFVAEYSTVLMQLEQRRDTLHELRIELRVVEKDVRALEVARRRLNKKFVDIVSQMKED